MVAGKIPFALQTTSPCTQPHTLLIPVVCLTNHWPLFSALHTTELCTLPYILLTPVFCLTHY